jgi:PIN domain-containing protein
MPSGASGARPEAARLASVTFFLDHQIGRYQVAEAMRSAGALVEVHLDHFRGDAPDVDWIPEVARRNWVLITKDQNIRRNPLERTAYIASNLRGFVLTGKDMNARDGRITYSMPLGNGASHRRSPRTNIVHDFSRRTVSETDVN